MPAYAPDSVTFPSAAAHGFLIDMDGVIYRGSELIPGADRFNADLLELELPFFFLTNNSQRTRRDVVTKLHRLGIEVDESHIFTCAMATGRKAFSVGKPSAVMMRAARKELGLDASRTTMIGDTMETDILAAVQLGYRAILVLSGGTARADLDAFAYRPDLVVESIADLSAADLAGLAAHSATHQ